LHVGLVCFLCRDQAPRTTVTATIGTPPCSALREYGLAFTPSSTGTPYYQPVLRIRIRDPEWIKKQDPDP
jgi:hypothetical protein